MKQERMCILLILLCSAFLLFFRLNSLSFSVDEFYNVEIDINRPVDILHALIQGSDLHPPLTHFISHIWIRILGSGEWAARSIWAMIGILVIAMSYRWGKIMLGSSVGITGAILLTSLPTFLLYTRFVKYYSLTMAFALLTAILFMSWLRYPSTWRLVAYSGVLTLYLYTDYFGPATWIIWSNTVALSQMLHRPPQLSFHRWKWFIVGQAICGILWLPWIFVAFIQTDKVLSMQAADLGGGVVSFILNIAQALYAFAIGETIFPWHVAGIAGTIIVVIAGVHFLKSLYTRTLGDSALWTAGYVLLSLGLVSFLTSTLIQGVPFIAFANHVLFVLPFFILCLSIGLLKIQNAKFRYGLMAGLLLVHSVGLFHYFTCKDFQNPIYIVPTREIVTQMATEVSSNDLVLAAPDIGIAFYAERIANWETPILDPRESQQSQGWILGNTPQHIWLFIFGRDRTRTDEPLLLQEWIEHRCSLEIEQGFAEQNTLYRSLKTYLFKRPAYQHKLTLYRYHCQ
ncbi:MAG: glycosyltransferase family 39 protein [Anaerolineae bacterium]|nr:glycosyltransferase family 39 protein [Anaerolineae bacterium]